MTDFNAIVNAHAGAQRRVNPHTGMAYAVTQSDVPFALDDDECPDCDGMGCIWNNADPTSGQWCACDTCGDTRGHP